MAYHCLFEQSGTFKNEFKKLGYEAYDYDILDDFGETDFKVDLFNEIETAYSGGVQYLTPFLQKMKLLLSFLAQDLKIKYYSILEVKT